MYGSDSSVPLPGLGTTSASADHSAVTPGVPRDGQQPVRTTLVRRGANHAPSVGSGPSLGGRGGGPKGASAYEDSDDVDVLDDRPRLWLTSLARLAARRRRRAQRRRAVKARLVRPARQSTSASPPPLLARAHTVRRRLFHAPVRCRSRCRGRRGRCGRTGAGREVFGGRGERPGAVLLLKERLGLHRPAATDPRHIKKDPSGRASAKPRVLDARAPCTVRTAPASRSTSAAAARPLPWPVRRRGPAPAPAPALWASAARLACSRSWGCWQHP